MANRMTAGQLDGLDAIHECEHCEGGAHCVTRGLIDEVRASWAERYALACALVTAAQAERSRLATADHRRQLADGWLDLARRNLPPLPTVDEMAGAFAVGRCVCGGVEVDGCCTSDHHADDVIGDNDG